MKKHYFNLKFICILIPIFLFYFLTSDFCILPSVFAGSETGTTAANFLKIPIAVVPSGMGQAYTAMVGPDSILFNPAGLGLLSYSAFSGVHLEYLENIYQEYVAVTHRSKFGTIGLAFSMLNSGKIVSYDENDMIIGNVRSYHNFGILSFSQSFPNFKEDIGMLDPMLITPNWTNIEPVKDYRPKVYRISFGASVKYIYEKLDDITSNTYTFDIGALAVLPNHIHLGASFLNLGGKQEFYSQSDKLPQIMRFGFAKDFHTVNDIMIFTVASDFVKESDYDFYNAFGVEIDFTRFFQMRAGYKTKKDIGSKLGGGFGLNLDRLTDKEGTIHGARIDYSYLNYGAFGATHRIGVQFIW
jgi:hypothetical protein